MDKFSVLYILPRQDYFEKGKNGSVNHASGLAEGLVQNNIKVSVLSGLQAHQYFDSTIESHEVIAPKSPFGIVWVIKTIFILNKLYELNKYDWIIIRYSVSNALLFSLFFLVKGYKNVIFEVNSLGIHQKKKYKFFSLILYVYEKFILNLNKNYYVVSKKIKEDIDLITNHHANVFVVPNGCNLIDFSIKKSNDSFLKIAYLGILHNYYDFTEIINAIAEMEDKNIVLNIFGDGLQYDKLKEFSLIYPFMKMYGRFDLSHVIEEGLVDDQTILLLPYKEGSLADIGSPTKLFEYMMLKLPILMTRVGQPNDIMKEEVNCMKYSNINECKEKIYLLKNKELRKIISQNSFDYFISSCTWKHRARSLLNEIEKKCQNTDNSLEK